MEKNPLGGSCGCFWCPQTSQEAVGAPTFCLESLLFPLSLFQSMETQAALPSSSGAGQVEKCRMGQSPSLFPAQGCTVPPALPSISSSSSLPSAMARRQVLPGVQVTPLGWFGPRLVPGCLSPEMCCFGAGGLSAFKRGHVGMPHLGCPGMNIQGLRAWLPVHNHLLSEPRSICTRPCIPPSTLGQFSTPLCPSSCCSSQRQTLHLICLFLILF